MQLDKALLENNLFSSSSSILFISLLLSLLFFLIKRYMSHAGVKTNAIISPIFP